MSQKEGVKVNIYLADFVICERNGEKHAQNMYHIYIKEMKNPFSVRLKTIAPASFTDSLRSLKNEGGRMRFASEGEALFRTITCSKEAQLYFVFKCTSQLYMFIVKLDLRQKSLPSLSMNGTNRGKNTSRSAQMNGWRWKNSSFMKCCSRFTLSMTGMYRTCSPICRVRNGEHPIPVHDLLSSPNGKKHFLSWLSYYILKI